MVPIVNEYVHPWQASVAAFVHFPTSGKSWNVADVEARDIVAENLNALMAYAKKTGHPERASNKGLAKLSGVSRPTIRQMRKAERAVGIDTLQAIAEVFEIEAWSLLVPHLEPSNPPTKPIHMSKTEIKLYTRLGWVARQYEEDEKAQRETGTGKTPNSNRNGSGAVGGGKSGGDIIPDD
jgi:transcriptional regulator with XRE-family HTH domain